MARSTSTTLRSAVSAQETGEAFLILLGISHADITDLYFVNNYTDVTGPAAQTYVAFPFSVTIPSDMEESLPRVQLTIDMVDQSIIDEIRMLTSAPDISISVVLASDPTTVEAGPFETKLRNVEYDENAITGDLQSEDILNEPYPGVFFTPNLFPGLF